MNAVTKGRVHVPKTKLKKRRVLRGFLIICLTLFLGGGGFLYGTNQGHQLRSMLVGTLLSLYHYPQYLKYLQILLPQSEINALYEARVNPPTEQTAIAKEAVQQPSSPAAEAIQLDTIDTAHYTAKVLVIPDPTTVHLVASMSAGTGQTLSYLVKNNHAIAGINAGGFVDKNGQGLGGQPIGTVISEGTILYVPNGDRNAPQLVGALLKNGQFITGSYSVNQLVKLGVTDAVGFGPQLIVNGQNCVTPAIDRAWGWAPRTAIGQEPNGSIVMIATDGRFYANKTHRGASMSDMVQLLSSYHVTNAMAMDGGASTTMIKDGQLLFKPATDASAGMRYLPNAWVVIPH